MRVENQWLNFFCVFWLEPRINLCKFFSLSDYERNEQPTSEIEKYQPSKSNTLNIKFILKYLLEWIIVCGVVSQKLRINLYASLLNCLSIVKDQSVRKSVPISNEK